MSKFSDYDTYDALGWLLKASGMVDQMATRSLERTPFTQLEKARPWFDKRPQIG